MATVPLDWIALFQAAVSFAFAAAASLSLLPSASENSLVARNYQRCFLEFEIAAVEAEDGHLVCPCLKMGLLVAGLPETEKER